VGVSGSQRFVMAVRGTQWLSVILSTNERDHLLLATFVGGRQSVCHGLSVGCRGTMVHRCCHGISAVIRCCND